MFLLTVRYLIEQRWLKQWKKYTGFDSWDQYHAGSDTVIPGPVDNSNLFESMFYQLAKANKQQKQVIINVSMDNIAIHIYTHVCDHVCLHVYVYNYVY